MMQGIFFSFLALKNEEILETALLIRLLTWEMHEFTWDVSMTQFDVAGVIKKKKTFIILIVKRGVYSSLDEVGSVLTV